MQSTGKGGSKTIEIDTQHKIYSILFSEDGKQVVGGGVEGILRRWRVDDGHDAGEPIQAEDARIHAAAMSPDGRWFVCGLRRLDSGGGKGNVRVWDAETCKMVMDIKGHTDVVTSVDVSSGSSKFATGSADKVAFIWSISTGKQLVGPLAHDGWVVALKFSPAGDRIATATAKNPGGEPIRIYDSDNGQLLLEIPLRFYDLSSALAWSIDGHELFAASYSEVKRFDTSSGSLLSAWSIPGGGRSASVAVARNQNFAVAAALGSLSFWDTSTQQQIGPTIKHTSKIWSIALSPGDDFIVTAEETGKVILRGLRDILSDSYLTFNVKLQLPSLYISGAIFKPWMQGDLTLAERLLSEEIMHPSGIYHRARALAHRSIVRGRSKQWNLAIYDAEQSIEVQQSVVGHIARAIAYIGSGKQDTALDVFDSVFSYCLPTEGRFLLLIKAVVLFQCGKHDDAISGIDRLIDTVDVDDWPPYVTVRAQMHLLLGRMSVGGDNARAIEFFKRAQDAIPVRHGPHLQAISLIFGWNFDRLASEIEVHLFKALNVAVESSGGESLMRGVTTDWHPDIIQNCVATFEINGDKAARSKDPEQAIAQYSAALSLNPLKPAELLLKRSTAQGMLGSWRDALQDSDEAIKVDPSSPWGYERRHAALHALQRYDEAIDAFTCMLSIMEGSPDQEIRQAGKKYISPVRSKRFIDDVIRGVFKISPLVLIDVNNGRLCDASERTRTFKSEPECNELLSSMTEELDSERVHRVVEQYFQYVTLSHVWQLEGKEPSFQDVSMAGSVWDLDPLPVHEKLRRFCEVVRMEGYRWAWSDTCCIDKTISTVLNQSLRMMYRWYRASTATFVHLVGVDSPGAPGGLTESLWMTRAWTAQELLAPKVIRFYTSDWKPYLSDNRFNHKDSPEIMQELADAIRIARETIIAFNPDDLSVREKLRLASARNATVEEDVAYSLIGIFKSDIRPDYGEGDAALGHLLEEIVARSGEVTVLAWTGKSSSYNSCLPASLRVYSQPPHTLPTIDGTEMEVLVAALKGQFSQTDVVPFHDRIASLAPARFDHRRLHLPCIIFPVKRVGIQDLGHGYEYRYRARVSGIGHVEFQTSDRLSLTEPRKLIFVHPWLRYVCDPPDGFTWGSIAEEEEEEEEEDASDSGLESDEISPKSPLHAVPAVTMDDYTRALRLLARLQQPFHMLLLQQQPNGEFKRVAAEHEIVVSGVERRINFDKDVRAAVVEIL